MKHIARIGMLLATLAAASCACWQPAHAQDKACVVLHQVIDCTETSVATLGPVVAGIISVFVQQGNVNIDWTAVEAKLEAAGIRDGGCVLAQLENDIIGKAQASPEKMERVKVVSDVFWRFKAKHGLHEVKYKILGSDGKPVLR